MSQLLAKPELADEMIPFLQNQLVEGRPWAVYDVDNPISGTWDICCFSNGFDAMHFAHDNCAIFNWHEAVLTKDLLSEIQEFKLSVNRGFSPIKTDTMNLNNLENLKEEMKALGFKDTLIAEMERNMEKNVPDFTLHETLSATKGQVDLTLHFKQSSQSEFYYFNKYDASLNTGKPLEDGQKYLVISPGEGDKPMFRKFENLNDAVEYFKGQKGDSELAIGKSPASKDSLATMEAGKVNYVKKEFQKTFYTPAVSQTFWIEKGKGFTAEQAANLIQGRSVYRDDLLNIGGMGYKAWIKLDFDKPKDRSQNYSTNQYHDPSYGFNLEKVLEKYNIKELADPAKKELLESSLKSGNRPTITTVKDGQEVKLFIEAVPRYSQVNMFAENGKPEKREQFLKEPEQKEAVSKGKGKEKELSESQGMKM